jgi:hypothetical protein
VAFGATASHGVVRGETFISGSVLHQGERLLEVSGRALPVGDIVQDHDDRVAERRGEWIEFLRAPDLGKRLVPAAQSGQQEREPVVRGCVSGL